MESPLLLGELPSWPVTAIWRHVARSFEQFGQLLVHGDALKIPVGLLAMPRRKLVEKQKGREEVAAQVS